MNVISGCGGNDCHPFAYSRVLLEAEHSISLMYLLENMRREAELFN